MEQINIAIAEDEHLVREGFKSIIDNHPQLNVVFCASEGETLVEFLRQTAHHVAIVILDLNMPGLNGIETTKKLQQLYPELRVIILTSYDTPSLIINLIRLGVSGYVLKNEAPEVLINTILQVHQNGFHHDEKVIDVLRQHAIQPFSAKSANFQSIQFTKREIEVLALICQEKTTQEIADQLFISPRTVEGHRNNMLIKTGVKNSVGLVLYAIKNKLIESLPVFE